MSALAKVRYRLAYARNSLIDLKPQIKQRSRRKCLNEIIASIEGLMDKADAELHDHRANASAAPWDAGIDATPGIDDLED